MNSRRSFDHLVGAGEQRRWHSEAKRLGSIEVDNKLEFRGLLHRQVWSLALEDPASVAAGEASLRPNTLHVILTDPAEK